MWQRVHGLKTRPAQEFTRKRLRRAQQGLYHGATQQHGHNISYSNKKTNRKWDPNVHWKSFHSVLLGLSFQVRVSTKALKCIDKAGGIDNYILFTKKAKLDSEIGERLRAQLKKKWEKQNGRKFSRCAELFKKREVQYQSEVKYNDTSRQEWITRILRETRTQQQQQKVAAATATSAATQTPSLEELLEVTVEEQQRTHTQQQQRPSKKELEF